MRGAKGVIINITGGDDLRLMEVDEAATHIREMVDPEANIIVGSAFNPELNGIMRVSVVATGIDVVARTPAVSTVSSGVFGKSTKLPEVTIKPPVAEPLVPVEETVAEPELLDLSLDDLIDEPALPEPLPERLPEPVAAVAAPMAPMHPQPEVEPKALTLFEKMMNLSRKPAARPAPTTLAPEPENGHGDGGQPEVAIPSFFKKQASN
jgi:cell division protein FtsZ